MVRSGMPLPSLLCVFGALLMLCPELLLGISEGLSDVPLTDPGVQRALAHLVQQYNQRRTDSSNYFKMLRLVQAQAQVVNGAVREYHLKVDLVKTNCKKRKPNLTYKSIQNCERHPRNRKVLNIYFVLDVSQGH